MLDASSLGGVNLIFLALPINFLRFCSRAEACRIQEAAFWGIKGGVGIRLLQQRWKKSSPSETALALLEWHHMGIFDQTPFNFETLCSWAQLMLKLRERSYVPHCAVGGRGTQPSKLAALLAAGGVNQPPPITNISTRPSFTEAYVGHEDPLSRCVSPPFPFLPGGGSWHQHIKDPDGKNLQCGGQKAGAVLTSPSSHRQGTAPYPASTCSPLPWQGGGGVQVCQSPI